MLGSLISATSLKVFLCVNLKPKSVRHRDPLPFLPSHDGCCHYFYAVDATQCTDALHLRIVTKSTKLMIGTL